MRILIHSNAPWIPNGYGVQTGLLIRQLKGLGHEVAVAAFYGLSGAPITWNDTYIYPAGAAQWGTDVLGGHARHFGADLIIALCDIWKLGVAGEELRGLGMPIACWTPVDCNPVSQVDQQALKAINAFPIAMTEWGQNRLHEAGFEEVPYVPHSYDQDVYYPTNDPKRAQIRSDLGLGGKLVIGINAANRDAVRKAWSEQFRGFRHFLDTCPDAMLLVHTVSGSPTGLNVRGMAYDMNIIGHTIWSDDYAQLAGHLGADILRDWYTACDVVLNATMGEGFGVPVIEAQACGTPVMVTRKTAPVNLVPDPGRFSVHADEFWNPVHHAWWQRPDSISIGTRLEALVSEWTVEGEQDRQRREVQDYVAERFQWDHVAAQHWAPALDQIAGWPA